MSEYQEFLFRMHGKLYQLGFNCKRKASSERLRKVIRKELLKEGMAVWSRNTPDGEFTKL